MANDMANGMATDMATDMANDMANGMEDRKLQVDNSSKQPEEMGKYFRCVTKQGQRTFKYKFAVKDRMKRET